MSASPFADIVITDTTTNDNNNGNNNNENDISVELEEKDVVSGRQPPPDDDNNGSEVEKEVAKQLSGLFVCWTDAPLRVDRRVCLCFRFLRFVLLSCKDN